ncbi:hypothetical protein [Pseudonocardia sp. D17]|uniref:hypothetical protein n=1 Tax=Pseudonocardia sp. D17 TaxID=882661 RepID=UPI002B3D3C1E|nr:hypothetical protein PSD17_24500 [Pseudonocardia sp. D17]
MAMTLRLSDDETEALRQRAETEHRSMQAVAQTAIREYLARRTLSERVDDALDEIIPARARLLDRLGNA